MMKEDRPMPSRRLVLFVGAFLQLGAFIHCGIYIGVTAGGSDRPSQIFRMGDSDSNIAPRPLL